jgi:hypothetical protein
MDSSTSFNRRHYQAKIILLCSLPAVSTELPRPGGDDVRARIAYRSHHDLPLGTMLRTQTGAALQTPSQGDQRLVVRQ